MPMFFESRVASLALLVALASAACAGSTVHPKPPADLSPSSLYPLRPGAAWSYDVDSGDGEPTLAIARVTRSEGGLVEVATGNTAAIGYMLRADGIARVPDHGYLLKAPVALGASWTSAPDTTARVAALAVSITVPAGTFSDCVTVQEDNATSGQHVTTTYCPGVGPAQVVSEMEVRGQPLKVVGKLRGYALQQ